MSYKAGRENVGKKGVVRDPEVHRNVIQKIVDFVLENGFDVLGLDFSPVKGPEGNIEYLLYIKKSDSKSDLEWLDIEKVVQNSHIKLNGGESYENSDNS